MTKKPRLRWKQSPRDTHAPGWSQDPSHIYHDGQQTYATAYQHRTRLTGRAGWYWVARNDAAGVPLTNAAHMEIRTLQGAKDMAQDYVKHHLRLRAASEGEQQ